MQVTFKSFDIFKTFLLLQFQRLFSRSLQVVLGQSGLFHQAVDAVFQHLFGRCQLALAHRRLLKQVHCAVVAFMLRVFAPGAYRQVAFPAEVDQLLHGMRGTHGPSARVSLPFQLFVREVEIARELLNTPRRHRKHFATRRTREAWTTGLHQTLETVQAECVVARKEARGAVHL